MMHQIWSTSRAQGPTGLAPAARPPRALSSIAVGPTQQQHRNAAALPRAARRRRRGTRSTDAGTGFVFPVQARRKKLPRVPFI